MDRLAGSCGRQAATESGRAATEKTVLATIAEILVDPRYRAFAAAVTECGRVVLPDAYPWRYLGWPEADFLAATDLCYENGQPIPLDLRRDHLGIVRAMEPLVVEWWQWWLGWECWAARHETQLEPIPPAAAPAGMLF